MGVDILSGVGLVVHEEKVQVAGVVDEESLVAGRHHVAGLDVATVADLYAERSLAFCSPCPAFSVLVVAIARSSLPSFFQCPLPSIFCFSTHLWHSGLALESSADTVVDTLWLSP